MTDSSIIRVAQDLGYDCVMPANIHIATCPAYKELLSACVIDVERIFDEEDHFQARILRHIHLSRRLKHENILPLYSAVVDQRSQSLILLSQIHRGQLSSIVEQTPEHSLPENVVLSIMKDVLNALSYIHARGIVHGGIHPNAIVLQEHGTARLTCFTQSVYLQESAVGQWHPCNVFLPCPALTPTYAPEILLQDLDGYDSTADIYSLALSALMLLGVELFPKFSPGAIMLRKATTLPVCDLERLDISEAFHDVLNCCLSPDPFHRPSADDLLKLPLFKRLKRRDSFKRFHIPQIHLETIENLKRRHRPQPEPLLPGFISRNPGSVLDPSALVAHLSRNFRRNTSSPSSDGRRSATSVQLENILRRQDNSLRHQASRDSLPADFAYELDV